MSEQNNVPTAPGWYYRDEPDPRERIVWVFLVEEDGRVHYSTMHGSTYDELHTKWRGCVPMPGVTELFSDTVSRMARILGMQAENDQRKACGHSMAYVEDDFLNEATP